MNSANKTIIINFIEEIWNQNQFEKIDKYMAIDYIDHSLPIALPANKEGMRLWIIGTGQSFEHKTIIEDIVSEDNKVMLKIKMHLKHIGIWRGIEATQAKFSTSAYRYYKLADGKIIEHWALIDGNSIEIQIKNAASAVD